MPQPPVDFAETFARLARSGETEQTTRAGGVATRLVRVPGGGTGTWGSHGDTAETVIVWSGDFTVTFRDGAVALGPGLSCIVPAGAEHHGTSRTGANVILFQTEA